MKFQTIQTSAADTSPPFDPSAFWAQFGHNTVMVRGVRLHFVDGGAGAPIILLPGWPQSWYAWRYVMPLLVAAGRRVIALDPRGMGDSDRPASGYDMRTVAAELHGLTEILGLTAMGPLDVVGHDVGTWIGYAYAAEWPEDVRRLVVLDAAIPGITPPAPAGIPTEEANVKSWHFAFNRLADLPEILLRGREREFLTWLFNAKAIRPWTIAPADLDEYVRVNAVPGALRAAFSFYRHNLSQEGIEQSEKRSTRKLTVPVLAFGAESGVGKRLHETMCLVATDVRGGIFANCGHYIPEEAPRTIAEQIVSFTSE